MKSYRLGLNVGTASVAAVAIATSGPRNILHSAVRIFNEPLLPPKSGGLGEPKKAVRRQARQQRRGHERTQRRLARLGSLGMRLGLGGSRDGNRPIHELRALAASARISLPDLARVFLKMAKRRGYAGSFRADGADDKEKGVMQTGIQSLSQILDEGGYKTLGQYLADRIRSGKHLRLKEDGLYISREMVANEFETIWDVQSGFHPTLNEDLDGRPLKAHYRKALLDQRPLKSPAPMVGNCSLAPMLPRASLAQPAAQHFRIEKQIADLRWGAGWDGQGLSADQVDIVRQQLNLKKEVKFNALYRAFEKAGCMPEPDSPQTLNLSQGGRESLVGHRTRAAMNRLKLLIDWNGLTDGEQISVINLLADMGSPEEVFAAQNWDKNLVGAKGRPRTVAPAVVAFINKMVASGKFSTLTKMGFDSGRAAYSIKALRTLTAAMVEHGVDEYGAIAECYPEHHAPREELLDQLPAPTPTGSVVVDVAMGQVRRVVNDVIAQLGAPPAAIVLELSRDIKAGPALRAKRLGRMRARERARKWAAKQIMRDTGLAASPAQVARYMLWQEQGKVHCPYCTRPIRLSQALDGTVTDKAPIIPASLSRLGRRSSHMVVAHRECNREKGNRTPWEAWGHHPARWAVVEGQAEIIKNGYEVTVDGKTRWCKYPGKAAQLLDKEVAPGWDANFGARQFQENAWVAKACAQWLTQICPDVATSRGLMTGQLRHAWGLDTVIPAVRFEEGMPVYDDNYEPMLADKSQAHCLITAQEFARYKAFWEGQRVDEDLRTHRRLHKHIDHRRHLVDALVIALTTRSLYQSMAKSYQAARDAGVADIRLHASAPIARLRERALQMVRDTLPTWRPDRRPDGNMFMDNPSRLLEIDGKQYYCQRKALSGISDSELKKVLPVSTRLLIADHVKQCIEQGDTLEQALAKPVLHPKWKTPIRRVTVQGLSAPDPVRVEHDNHQGRLYKYLAHRGYAYLEYDARSPTDEPKVLRLLDVKRGRPRQDGQVRLYKGDTVYHPKAERHYVIRQLRATPSLVLTPVTESISDSGKVSGVRKKIVTGKRIRDLVPAHG